MHLSTSSKVRRNVYKLEISIEKLRYYNASYYNVSYYNEVDSKIYITHSTWE